MSIDDLQEFIDDDLLSIEPDDIADEEDVDEDEVEEDLSFEMPVADNYVEESDDAD